MKRRSGNVELARFIGSLVIMASHLEMILAYIPLEFCWIYVEFFLIITGYYTAKHFDGISTCNPIRAGVKYTIKKFIPVLPYTTAITTLMYISIYSLRVIENNINIRSEIFEIMRNYILDILLIRSCVGTPLVSVLWFLSVMFVVFPVFSVLMQINNRYHILAITFIYSLLYYGINGGVVAQSRGTIAFLRVLAGMCLGALLYELSYIFAEYIERANRMVLTLVETITFVIPILFIVYSIDATTMILLCFTVCLFIMLSNLSYSSRICGDVCIYLGRLSMPIYIMHTFVGGIVWRVSNLLNLTNSIRVFFYYGATIVAAVISTYMLDHWKWFQDAIKRPFILKD